MEENGQAGRGTEGRKLPPDGPASEPQKARSEVPASEALSEDSASLGRELTPGEAAEHLRVIRRFIERPVRMTTRSGLAAIVAGLLAIVGTGVTWLVMLSPTAEREGSGEPLPDMLEPLPDLLEPLLMAAVVWLAVFVLAAAANVLIVRHRARLRGHSWWRREQLQTAMAILPGFFLAAVGTVVAANVHVPMVPFVWMIGYGMALWAVGVLSIAEVRALGAGFLICGWLGVFLMEHISMGTSLAMLAVTFGGFHLVYGVIVRRRHGG